MTVEEKPSRSLFEEFHADARFAELREIRSRMQPAMRVLQENVTGFRKGKTPLRPDAIHRLREYVLEMLQIQYAMIEACDVIPPEFEPVKNRILADFDTEAPKAYLQKVNDWIRVIQPLD
ncbi:hypothetical protein ACLPJF_21200 [Pseudomonas vlassakiae]|uniref:hypothetical protein n=1 Tax=Pseudomonas TaxID=286 RepID=UPI001C26545C|nr:hypothetical protein [Pseudomonas shirazica]